jgi:hypothetical protein
MPALLAGGMPQKSGGISVDKIQEAREQAPCLEKGSTPLPSTKSKRAPRGTFDRKAYQRELMRKRRQAEKKEQRK